MLACECLLASKPIRRISFSRTRQASTRRAKLVFRPVSCQQNSEKSTLPRATTSIAGIRSLAATILVSSTAWLAPPVLAMQEFANDFAADAELGLGLDMMPDTSLVTMATLVYCSLAFMAMFLHSEEEPEGTHKPKTESKASAAKPEHVYHAPTTSYTPPSQPLSPSCPSYQQARMKQLAESATSNVAMAIRDAKYLLHQIVPDHMHAACNGVPPPSQQSPHGAVTDVLHLRGREEAGVRDWLHALSEAYLVAKQSSTGLSRDTAARVVLNNQEMAVRDISKLVAREAAVMAAINVLNTMVVDSAFANKSSTPPPQ